MSRTTVPFRGNEQQDEDHPLSIPLGNPTVTGPEGFKPTGDELAHMVSLVKCQGGVASLLDEGSINTELRPAALARYTGTSETRYVDEE
jgi:hypothetical protein